MATTKSNSVTIPRWLYESMVKDCDLVMHLEHYRGRRWIEAVRKEMESDKRFGQGAFNKNENYCPRIKENIRYIS